MLICFQALGDLVESCVGAILLDSGFNLEVVWKIMISFLDPVMKFSTLQLNPIRELQELCQFYNWELTFPSVKKDGVFTVDAVVDGSEVCETACATNSNKKTAKRIACQKLYLSLKVKRSIPFFFALFASFFFRGFCLLAYICYLFFELIEKTLIGKP